MKRSRIAALALGALALFMSGAAMAQYYATANYQASGSDWEIGGTFNIASGGKITVAGVDKTAALSGAVANPAAGLSAGVRMTSGETALDGSNPTPVTTGLTTITACALTLKTTAAPGVGTSVVTYGSSAGTLNLYGWKVTSNIDDTLVASTGTDTVGWVCFGT